MENFFFRGSMLVGDINFTNGLLSLRRPKAERLTVLIATPDLLSDVRPAPTLASA